MTRCRYQGVVTLGLLIAFGPVAADAQEMARPVQDSSKAPRLSLLLTAAEHLSQPQPDWRMPARLTAGGELRGVAGAPGGQDTLNARSERSVTRKVLGALVGAAGGLFAGGYVGAAIEGDGCHCDDPGLMGALIGAPVGAAAGGILGALFLF